MKRFIGDRAFYKKLFAIMLPILLQNVITNFVSLLDNIMVGQIGTEPMSGVAIVNQLMFVFNLSIFGGLAGAGIFTAQYYGSGNDESLRNTFRVKLYIAAIMLLVFYTVFITAGKNLILLFLHQGNDNLDLAATLGYAQDYLRWILPGLIPFAITQIYSSTMRETGETLLPMKAGIAAVLVNLFFNYMLIFGKLGAPQLGVIGAAIATDIARVTECAIVVCSAHLRGQKFYYFHGVYSTLRVPMPLLKQIFVLGSPLLLNELMWSAGMTVLNQCYSLRGLEVISALNISSTVSNLFFCSFLALGNSISIIVGQQLGAGTPDEAVDTDTRLIAFSVVLSVFVGAVFALLSPLFPQIYNTTALVKQLAWRLLLVEALLMPVYSFTNACYFTLRCGGKTWITFLFDSFFVWVVSIPVAFCLTRFTQLPIVALYLFVQLMDLIKCVIGFVMVHHRKWVNNLAKE